MESALDQLKSTLSSTNHQQQYQHIHPLPAHANTFYSRPKFTLDPCWLQQAQILKTSSDNLELAPPLTVLHHSHHHYFLYLPSSSYHYHCDQQKKSNMRNVNPGLTLREKVSSFDPSFSTISESPLHSRFHWKCESPAGQRHNITSNSRDIKR